MKNLLPISKLYNFNVKVFKNLFGLLFYFFLCAILLNQKSLATVKLVTESKGEVLFISKGHSIEWKNSRNSADDVTGDACWYNIFDKNGGSTNLYDEANNKFVKGYYTGFDEFAKAIATRGFCVQIPKCIYEEPEGVKFSTSQKLKIVFDLKDRKKLKAEFKATATPPFDLFTVEPFNRVPMNDENCADRFNNEQFIVKNPAGTEVAFATCEEALDKVAISISKGGRAETPDEKKARIAKNCQTFICNNSDIKSQITGLAPNYCAGAEDLLDKSCLTSGGDCNGCGFRESSDPDFLNGCVWDQDKDTGDSCGEKETIREKDGSKFFCSVSNRIIKCRETGVRKFAKYEDVFTKNTAGDFTSILKDKENCTDIYSTDACTGDACSFDYKAGDPTSCCFGSGSNSCAGKGKILPSLDGGGKYLYCASDNKVVSCPAGTNPVTGDVKIRKYYEPAPVAALGDIPGVFRNNQYKSTEINLSANCSAIESPLDSPIDTPEGTMGGCSIDGSLATCEYGDPTIADDCWNKQFYLQYGSKNLFCSGQGKTYICDGEIKKYDDAFPGGSPTGTTWNPNNKCKEYNPGENPNEEEEIVQCGLVEEGQIFFVGIGKELDEGENLSMSGGFETKKRELAACISKGGKEEKCYQDVFGAGTSNSENFFVCECSTKYNPTYDPLGCTLNPFPDDKNCTERCVLVPTTFAEYSTLKTQAAVNPLGIIKTVSDFLFAFAVFIFIVNMLRGSFIYVTSGGDESKMKEAQTTITNTIFGMVFIVFIGALLRWVITIATTATTS
jgi:hypothetical protein